MSDKLSSVFGGISYEDLLWEITTQWVLTARYEMERLPFLIANNVWSDRVVGRKGKSEAPNQCIGHSRS